MGIKVGIVGLPNVGKSTLFNAITNLKVESANYSFTTIKPNIGIVEVPDYRLDHLFKIFNSKKIIYPTIEFVDIAGLIAGASKGLGYGNAFLANIRETDLICHIVRCFDSKEITHVEGSVDSIRDIEIIQLELIYADEESVKKRMIKLEPKYKNSKDKQIIKEYELLKRIKQELSNGVMINTLTFDQEEKKLVKSFQLITSKQMIYVGNCDENCLKINNDYYEKLALYAKERNQECIKICAKFEEQLSELNKTEKSMFLDEFGVKYTGLETVIKTAYRILDLRTYFTCGPQEIRGWQFKKGTYAPKCAGIIHTDFEKKFIKVEVYAYEDIVEFGSETEVRNQGRIRQEGKKYQVQDGDICFFKFNK